MYPKTLTGSAAEESAPYKFAVFSELKICEPGLYTLKVSRVGPGNNIREVTSGGTIEAGIMYPKAKPIRK